MVKLQFPIKWVNDMANLHLVTGYAGREHVTSADQGAFNASLFGTDQWVMNKGNKFAASVISNNQVRIADGDIYMQGRYVRMDEGTYVDMTIGNGAQGQLRNDLIVARYTKNASSAIEDVNLVVIKGVPVDSNPVDPAYTIGNILEDHVLVADMPLWRIPLDGLNIGEPVCLFTVYEGTIPDINAKKQDKTDSLIEETAIADTDAFPFFDQSASAHRKTLWSNIKTALGKVFAPLTHKHNASDISTGAVSVVRGGTGANDAEGARSNLGAAPAYTYGTEDLIAGETALETGKVHFVYE